MYSKIILGQITINYIDKDSKAQILASDVYTNLELKEYTYDAKDIKNYKIYGNSSISVILTQDNQNQTITFEYEKEFEVLPIDIEKQNEVPYISTYYIKPIVKPDEEVIIDYYITDYYHKEYVNEDYSELFTVTVRVEGKDDIVVKELKAGDHSISLGSFPELDGVEQKFSILCTDQYGRNSHELFNFFLVRNDVPVKEYVMTEEDLVTYNIKNTDDYEIFKLINVDMSTTTVDKALQLAYDNEIVESNKYVILAADSNNDGIADLNYKNHLVKYADNYNSESVATASTSTREGLQKLLDDKANAGFNKVKLLKGTYRIDNQPIYIPSNFILDMNKSTIKLNGFTGDKAIMVDLNNTFDSHAINGTIEGDYFTHDYTNSPNGSEWVHGINIGGESKYSSFEDITVKDITGYGSNNGIAKSRNGNLGYAYYYYGIGDNFKLGDIDRTTGLDIQSTNRTTCNFKDISIFESLGYLSVSKYLGYQGNSCGSWNLICHFYDEDKQFIKSVDAYQYRSITIPTGSKYVRVTILSESYPTDLTINLFRIPTHCAFKRVIHDNCRAVGMAPCAMKDMLVEDCEFTRSGQNLAKCAFDAEDGWDLMQDVTFRRLNFHDNPNNDFLTCAGHNFIVENMIDGNVGIWDRTKDFILRNSNCNKIDIGYSHIVRHGVSRIYNNTINSGTVNENIGRNMIQH